MRKKRIRVPNAKPVVKKHLERAAHFIWKNILKDPRSDVNKEWNFEYLMVVAWLGMLTGCKNLRAVEDFSECYRERVPDTTLHDLIIKIDYKPLRLILVNEVKKALRAHELPKDSFPVRITAIDGKCGSISKQSVGNFSQKSECNGTVYYVNRVLRAFHVSNETKLILYQRKICGKKSEMSEFIDFVDELLTHYGRTDLLEVFSIDAGMISKENADYIIDKSLDYIMALKNPQKKLVELAHELLGSRTEPNIETKEKVNGKLIIRRLFRCTSPGYPGWSHLKEFWRIQQTTIQKRKKDIVEERYFITSLNPNILNDSQVLQAIRMHWGIENNANWVTDTAWTEDDSPWSNKAFEFVTLLRILAYNVLSRLKTRRLRKKNDRERSWKGIMRLIDSVLINLQNEIAFLGDYPVFIE